MQESKNTKAGKPARTDSLTIRLDPKLRFLVELAARRQRRSLTSFIEWAVEKALAEVTVRQEGDWKTSLLDVAPKVWAIEPSQRLLNIAQELPDLLSYDEELIWNAIRTVTAVESWKDAAGKYQARTASFMYSAGTPNCDVVRKCWNALTGYAASQVSEEELKKALIEHADIPF